MTDRTTFRLSAQASEIGKEITEQYNFRDSLKFFQFAMAYALEHHLGEIEFEKLDEEYDTDGSTYNVGSIAKSSQVATIITQLIPGCQTPFRYIRVLMIFGTLKIKGRLDKGEDFSDIAAISQ